MNKDKIDNLPNNPGCYLFKDKENNILYIGKAKNLKKRVSSYFNKIHGGKTAKLVSLVEQIDFIITRNEVEAFLLENNLIKKYYPKYNIDLKDSRRYAYILIHQDKLPWIEIARLRESKGEYYGPFVSGTIRKLIIDLISRNFRIFAQRPSPQLRKSVDAKKYNERVEQARKILAGNVDEVIKELTLKMKRYSENTNYEYAITLRNQISALKTLKEKQLIELSKTIDVNILNYSVVDDSVFLIIFNIRKGVLEEKQSYNFQYYEDFLEDFLVQYYDTAPLPQELILPEKVDLALEEYLRKKSKRKFSITVPKKGDKKDLLELVYKNIQMTFFVGEEKLKALQEIIGLRKVPRRIECFDISHLGGTNTVASMVSFSQGLPDKKSYRKFKISADINDDYLAMKEVVRRRYSGSLSKSLDEPDLIVVDGGKGQLNAAKIALKNMGKNIPIISLAKRMEEIYIFNKKDSVKINHKNKGLQLLMAIRDEAHRFAINYQRNLRNKNIFRENGK